MSKEHWILCDRVGCENRTPAKLTADVGEVLVRPTELSWENCQVREQYTKYQLCPSCYECLGEIKGRHSDEIEKFLKEQGE